MFVPNTLTMDIAFILNTNIYPQAMASLAILLHFWKRNGLAGSGMYQYTVTAGFTVGNGWENSPELSHTLREGLGATTRRQWDDQTLIIGAYAIEEIFLPFRQAHGNSAAISAMLWYYLADIQATGNPRPIRSTLIIRQNFFDKYRVRNPSSNRANFPIFTSHSK